MELVTQSWEHNLLRLANEALKAAAPHTEPLRDEALLRQAYDHCRKLTARHSRSFYVASGLLPADQREAVRALYAFCRTSDDVVDIPTGEERRRLTAWRRRSLLTAPPADDPVAVAWADARARYQIPVQYAEQLLDGVGRDLKQTRYESFEELASYCYGVASTVGLMSMHIVGFAGPEAIPYAVKLGVALQLTNILRDVGEDWRAGRVYLPQEELRRFGLTEEDLATGQVDERWRAFMRFQIERVRRLYREAWPGIGLLAREGQLAIAAAAELYQDILGDIEAHDYDVFNRRAFVSGRRKAARLARLWWRHQRGTLAAHAPADWR